MIDQELFALADDMVAIARNRLRDDGISVVGADSSSARRPSLPAAVTTFYDEDVVAVLVLIEDRSDRRCMVVPFLPSPEGGWTMSARASGIELGDRPGHRPGGERASSFGTGWFGGPRAPATASSSPTAALTGWSWVAGLAGPECVSVEFDGRGGTASVRPDPSSGLFLLLAPTHVADLAN